MIKSPKELWSEFLHWLLSCMLSNPTCRELLIDEIIGDSNFTDNLDRDIDRRVEDALEDFERNLSIDADEIKQFDDAVDRAVSNYLDQRGVINVDSIDSFEEAVEETVMQLINKDGGFRNSLKQLLS